MASMRVILREVDSDKGLWENLISYFFYSISKLCWLFSFMSAQARINLRLVCGRKTFLSQLPVPSNHRGLILYINARAIAQPCF